MNDDNHETRDEYDDRKEQHEAASEIDVEVCDECGHLPAIGNVVYEDSGERPLCSLCNTAEALRASCTHQRVFYRPVGGNSHRVIYCADPKCKGHPAHKRCGDER
jgi:hypothetical protein